MNLLLIVDSFPPDISSAAHYFHELGCALTERSHRVTVLTRMSTAWSDSKTKLNTNLITFETWDNMRVYRVALLPVGRQLMFIRGLVQLQQFFLYLYASLISGRQDVALIYSPRFLSGLCACSISIFKRIPFIANVQDIFPQCLIDLGKLKNPIIIYISQLVQSFTYKEAKYITVHSDGNREVLVKKGVRADKLVVIPNWVDVEFLRPGNRLNTFRREHGLGEKFIVSFAGRMDYSQDINTIIEAAALLKEHSGIFFLLVGEGLDEEKMKSKVAGLKLLNVKFLPLQTKDKYPQLLEASDIGLVTLRKEVVTPVVPSKLLSIMASGRPVVASLSKNGDAVKLIHNANCGICVEPENSVEFSQAILQLYGDPELRDKFSFNGRQYAEKHFSKPIIINHYENILLSAK